MQSPQEPDVWDARSRLTAATIGLAAFLTNFDVTSVVVVMPAIGTDLGVPIARWAWIVDAYSLAFTATLLIAGALADRFGRRLSLLIGNVWFLLASLACGLAPDGPLFFAARVAQGGGAAFLVTGGFASIATAFPAAAARARALGVVGVVSGVSMALGPSLGGIIGSGFGWRWIFLANLPFCALIAWAVPRVVAEMRDDTGKPLDLLGVAILTMALAAMIEAILEARHSTIYMAISLASSVALVATFALQQRQQLRPMLDPTVFASRPMVGVTTLLMAVSAGYWAVLVYLPLFLTAAFNWSADAIGLAMLAATLPMLVLPLFGGRLAAGLGLRTFFAVALMLIAIGGGTLVSAAIAGTVASALVCTIAGMILIGVGAAMAHPQLTGAVIALAPLEASGMASAITVVARQAGFAIGVAALGALTPANLSSVGFVWPFGFAAVAAAGGVVACSLLPRFSQQRQRQSQTHNA